MRRLGSEERIAEAPGAASSSPRPEPRPDEASAFRRDRLLAAIALIAGSGLALALPFALRAGAEFFLPVTVALVIAIALVPMLEWLERRGLPSALAAFLCVVVFLGIANIAVASIVLPAADWVRLLPDRIGRVRDTLAPLMHVYSRFQRFVDGLVRQFTVAHHATRTVTVEPPNSLVGMVVSSAPAAVIQMLFGLSLIHI